MNLENFALNLVWPYPACTVSNQNTPVRHTLGPAPLVLYLYLQSASDVNSSLPDARGPLSEMISSSSIAVATERVDGYLPHTR